MLEEGALVLSKGVDGGRVHHHALARASAAAARRCGGQTDASGGSVLVGHVVKEGLCVVLGADAGAGLHGEREQQDAVLAAGAQAPPRLEVLADGGDVETAGHLGGDETGDE